MEWNKFLKHVPGFIRHDFWRKFSAFSLAAIVYLWVQPMQRAKIATPVKLPEEVCIELVAPNGYVLAEEDKSCMVSVDIRTLQKDIENIKMISDPVEVPLSKKRGNDYSVTFPVSKFKKINGITIDRIIPSSKWVTMYKIITRTVPVKTTFKNRELLPDGYSVASIKVQQKVQITGAENIVSQIQEIPLEPINLEGVTRSFSINAKVIPQKFIEITPSVVTVHVNVNTEKKDTLYKIPLRILYNEQNRQHIELIDHAAVDVTVSGQPDAISKLKKENIKVFIDTTNVNEPGISTLKIDCWSTVPDIKVNKFFPRTIKVKYKK